MKKRPPCPALSFLLPLLFILPLQACFSIRTPELESVENVSLGRENRGPLTLKADLVLFNPNRFKVTLKRASGEVWLDGRNLGRFSMDSQIRVRPASRFNLPVKLELDSKKMLGNTLTLLLNEEVELRVVGQARAVKSGIGFTIPIEYKGKQSRDKFLSLSQR